MNTTKQQQTVSKPIISITTNTLNDIIPLLFQNPIISAYLDRFKPINEKAISNECYSIRYSDIDKASKGYQVRIDVFINPAYTVCC